MRTKEWLVDQRTKHVLTQRQLANKIGVSCYTIENIEQGKRMGSADVWEKIENYFNYGEERIISYDSSETINDINDDILEFGKDSLCYLIYKVQDSHIIFTSYILENDEDLPFDEKKDVENDEKYIKTSLQYALEVFKAQNNII